MEVRIHIPVCLKHLEKICREAKPPVKITSRKSKSGSCDVATIDCTPKRWEGLQKKWHERMMINPNRKPDENCKPLNAD